MALTIRKMAMPTSKYSIKCPYTMTPTRIVIHNTANDASAENEIRYMQSNNAQTSFHFAVDDKEAVQGVDIWRNAWHAGDGNVQDKNSKYYSKGNLEGIAIEICYSKSGGTRFIKAEENAAELAAKLLIDFGWGIDKITKHQDYSGKYCPHRTLDMGWDRFVNMVEKKRKELLGTGTAQKEEPKKEDPKQVTLNGYTIERVSDFSIVYWDKSKKKGTAKNYINGGFFAYYKEGSIQFTLPVGNLVCDVVLGESVLKNAAFKYIQKFIQNGKFRFGTANNFSAQFKNKALTTFVIPHTGAPYVREMTAPPSTARYAISGIPVIRNGQDVSYNNFVVPQGWDASPMYATTRNFIGLKGTSIYIVSGKSKTSNFVATSEVYNALKSFGFNELIALDGGGSHYHKYNGKAGIVWGDREVNNIVVF